MRKLIIPILCLALVLNFAGCGGDTSVEGEMTAEEITELAKCLGGKEVKMYGSVGCGHCQKQKDAFGESFENIEYIECNPNIDLDSARKCQAAGITGVPTWEFPDGTKKIGETGLPELAEAAGC